MNLCIEIPVRLNVVLENNSIHFAHDHVAEGVKNVSVSENEDYDSRFLF